MTEAYRIFMNKEKTVAVEIWAASGYMCVKTRETPDDIWSPPIAVEEERITESDVRKALGEVYKSD